MGLALACALLPAGALPQEVTSPTDEIAGLSAGDLFRLADDAIAARRFADAEAFLRAIMQDRDVDLRTEARFRLALLLDSQQRRADAAVLLRAILDEKPQAGRVRIELARILASMGEEGRAGAQLRAAQAGGLPEDVAQIVDQMAAALRSTRPLGGSFELTFAPDTNINRATNARTLDTVIGPFDLSADARAQSGLGVRVAGQIYGRVNLTPGMTLVPRAGGEAALYRQSAANDLTGTLGLGLEMQAGRSRFTPIVSASWRDYGGQAFARTFSAGIDWRRPLDRQTLGTASLSVTQAAFMQSRVQDGRIFAFSFGLERALSARSGLGVTVSAARQTARDPGYANASGGINLVGWHDIGRTTLFANAGLRRLETDKRLALFTDRRKEWFLQVSGGAVFRQITVAGFSPLMRATYEWNSSTVGQYSYRRVTGQIGITRAF